MQHIQKNNGNTEQYPGCEKLNYGNNPEFIIKIIETTRTGMWDWNLTDDSFAVNNIWANFLFSRSDSLAIFLFRFSYAVF